MPTGYDTMKVPPVSLPDRVRRAVPLARPAASLSATAREPLPVLEAFQVFIESERQRARVRLRATVLSFTLLLLITTSILGGAFFIQIRDLKNDLSGIRSTMETSLRKEIPPETAFDPVEFAQTRTAIHDVVLRQQTAEERLQADLSRQGLQQATAIQELKALMESIKLENSVMATRFETIAISPQTTAPPPIDPVLEELSIMGQDDAAPTTGTVPLEIPLHHAGQPVAWRIPLPTPE